MQAAGQRAKRQAASMSGGGASESKQQREQAKAQPAAQLAAPKRQKRRASDVAVQPAAKKKARRSAPELPKAGGPGHATPVAPSRSAYNLRTRSSMPAAGTRLTDNSLPTGGLPSSVRPRNPNQKATWNELPAEVLKTICQNLDPATVLAARRVASTMREACSSAPVRLRFTLPMQSSPWVPAQLEAWDRRVNGVVRLLSSGKMLANELQLRMEGAASWKGEESMPHAHVHNTQQRLLPVLMYLRKLGALKATPITHLDVELPATAEIVSLLSTVLPDVTSLRLDSLIPPPHNHVQALCDSRAFVNIRKLDVCVTAWDQIQHLSHLSQLTELNVRYNMWNIPELTPLASLLNLTTFGIEVLDDRARFQLDFLGPVVRGVPRLRHLRAAIILSRTVVSESGPASCDFLVGCSLQTLDLDVRVPQDAARTVHAHFRNLHLAPQGCKVNLTIHADALSRETSFESAATRCVNLSMPRLGMAQPSPPEPKERWGALNMSELGSHAPDALSLLHLRGYRSALSMLPDLSAARLTRLQISNARLSPADFTVLGGCTTLEHLFVSFTYQPDTAVPGTSSAGDLAVGMGQSGMESRVLGVHDLIRPRELQASLRLVAHGSHGMVTRSRKSLQGAGRRSSGSAAAAPPQLPLDCSSRVAPYVLRPLLQLRKLRSLELLEEPQPPVEPAPRLSAVGASTGGPAAPAAARTRRAAQTGAAGAAGSAAGTAPAQPAPSQAQNHAQTLLPLSRSGLNHFLMNVAMLSNVAAVHIRLLSEEADLPDCPCRVPCFSVATKGKEPLFDVDAEAVEAVFTAMEPNCYKIVLGSMVAQSPIWYRPSAWPSLEG